MSSPKDDADHSLFLFCAQMALNSTAYGAILVDVGEVEDYLKTSESKAPDLVDIKEQLSRENINIEQQMNDEVMQIQQSRQAQLNDMIRKHNEETQSVIAQVNSGAAAKRAKNDEHLTYLIPQLQAILSDHQKLIDECLVFNDAIGKAMSNKLLAMQHRERAAKQCQDLKNKCNQLKNKHTKVKNELYDRLHEQSAPVSVPQSTSVLHWWCVVS